MKKIIYLISFHKLSKHLCIMKSRIHLNRHLREKKNQKMKIIYIISKKIKVILLTIK